jgi:hypothetical protein
MSRTTGCLLAACAWLVVAATSSAARAQEPDQPEDVVLAQRADVVATEEFEVENSIFGNPDPGFTRKKLESALAQTIKRFDQKYTLSPTQKKKLELAGNHDIKQFFDRVEEVKSEFKRNNGDWNKVGERVIELQRIHSQPHSELLGEQSMLVKTLKKNLTTEQIARSDKTIYRARVEWMAGLLHSRLILESDQRRRLVTLIVEETPPLKRYGSFDYDAIMFQLSRLPQEKLRTVLNEGQCRELSLRFDQARRMESILVSEGYVSAVQSRGGSAAEKPGRPSEPGEAKTVLTRQGHGGSE